MTNYLGNDREIRNLALKMSLDSYENIPGVTTETIVNRANEFEMFIKEGKKTDVV